MLRITMEERHGLTTFRLEGKLIGDWVDELERCWVGSKSCESHVHSQIDLNEVVFVDEHGKALLKRLAEEGAELQGNNLFMRSVIDRILEPPHEPAGNENRKGALSKPFS